MTPEQLHHALWALDLVYPYHTGPNLGHYFVPDSTGRFIIGSYHVADTEEDWNAYHWNPPHYRRPNVVFRATPWEGPWDETNTEDLTRFNRVAYMPRTSAVPPVFERDGNRHPVTRLPNGFTDAMPQAGTQYWVIGRTEERTPADGEYVQADPDPNASPKPTWQELVNAEITFDVWFIGERNDDIVDELRVYCEKRICDTVFGANSLTHEMQIRNRLVVTGSAADAAVLESMSIHRDHLRGRYHEIKQWMNSLSVAVPADGPKASKFLAILLASPYMPNTRSGYSIRYRRVAEATEDEWNALWTGATWIPPGETVPYSAYNEIPPYADVAPTGAPPFALILAPVSRTGTTHRYSVTMTAGAEVTFSADNTAVTFPQATVSHHRAGTVEFDAVIPYGAGEVVITATASPYGEETTGTATIADVSLPLGTPDTGTTNVLIYTPSVRIPPRFVDGGGEAWLRGLTLRGAGSGMVEMSVASTAAGTASDAGPELTSAWETDGSLVVTSGGQSVTILGPNAPGNMLRDDAEPYFWTVAGSGGTAALDAFITAIRAMSPVPSASVDFVSG